jgi:hypothetical protein
MKKLYLILLLLVPLFTMGQQTDRQVIGSAGSYGENTNGSLSWSIGETMVETFANSSNTLTQGFHQGSLSVPTLINDPGFEVDVSVYPNPVQNHLTINADVQGAEYRIVNMQGKVVKNGKIDETALQIDFSHLSRGAYLLKLNGQNTHKIIKQ